MVIYVYMQRTRKVQMSFTFECVHQINFSNSSFILWCQRMSVKSKNEDVNTESVFQLVRLWSDRPNKWGQGGVVRVTCKWHLPVWKSSLCCTTCSKLAEWTTADSDRGIINMSKLISQNISALSFCSFFPKSKVNSRSVLKLEEWKYKLNDRAEVRIKKCPI